MSRLVHLNALHALDAALRQRTLRKAAEELGVTQAAIGQRIRALELFLDEDLLVRSATGVAPTALAAAVQADLAAAFALLDNVADTLNLDHDTKLRLLLDGDFAALWLRQRLPEFERLYPGIKLECTESGRPVPWAHDLEVFWGNDPDCPALWQDRLIPVLTDEIFRIANSNDRSSVLEGVPLLHLADKPGAAKAGWSEWIANHGMRQKEAARELKLASLVQGLSAAVSGAGVLLGPSLLLREALDSGALRHLFSPNLPLDTANAFRLRITDRAAARRPVKLFCEWLQDRARQFAEG